MLTVSEMVRAQVLTEGPIHKDEAQAMAYVEQTIDEMTNTELLERISDAIAKQLSGGLKP